MYWQEKKLDYDILIPPLDKPFKKLTKKQAEKYFIWYKSQLTPRVEYLQSYSGVVLDYSVDSLIDIWDWFLSIAETEETPQVRLDELREELKHLPPDLLETALKEHSRQLSLQTEYIVRDIAMYFGEVYVKNNSAITWGYHTNKRLDSFYNRPLLVGFEDWDYTPPFQAHWDPLFWVRKEACSILYGDQRKDDLLLMYNKWQRMVYN